jgi:hypothetical protein
MKKATNTDLSWSEDRLQQEIVMWFHNSYPQYRGLLFSVPNGLMILNEKGEKNWTMIKRFKRTGMWSGVSDLILLFSGRAYLMELKRPDGKNGQSKDQLDWQEKVELQGFDYKLFNDLLEMKEFITNIVDGIKNKW